MSKKVNYVVSIEFSIGSDLKKRKNYKVGDSFEHKNQKLIDDLLSKNKIKIKS